MLLQAETRRDYRWVDLIVQGLKALHNDEEIEFDEVLYVFVGPEDADEEEDKNDEDDE